MAAELQKRLQSHVNSSQDSLHHSAKPKLQRQSTITDSQEDVLCSTDDQDISTSHSSMDVSDPVDNNSHSQCVSDFSDGRPSWTMERAYHRSKPTLRM